MSTPLPIDVIIPAWGDTYAQHLPRALASASSAVSRVIVGDDHTRAAGLAAGATTVLNLQDRHPGPARMQAFAATTQPYVLFMDADDAILPGGLEHLYDILNNHPRAVAAAGYFRRSSDGSQWPQTKHARLAVSPIGLHALMFRNMLPAHGSILIRRTAIESLREPFETAAINEDWHGIIRLRAAGKIIFTHTPIYDYTIHSGSMSRSPRDLARSQHSHDTLIDTAEKALGRIAPTLRVANMLAKPARDRHIRKEYGAYYAPENTVAAADITYE